MSNLLQSLIITKLIKLFYLFCSCKNIVGKSKEYLKAIKNTLLDTSGNPETLKKKKKIIEVGQLFNKGGYGWRGFS